MGEKRGWLEIKGNNETSDGMDTVRIISWWESLSIWEIKGVRKGVFLDDEFENEDDDNDIMISYVICTTTGPQKLFQKIV